MISLRSILITVAILVVLAGGLVLPQAQQEPVVKSLSSAQKDDAKKAVLCEDSSFEAAMANVRKVGPLSKNAADDFLKKFTYPYPTQKTGITKRTVDIKLGQRSYALFVPASYVPAKSWPLIISFHGAGGNGEGVYNWIWSAHSGKWNGFIACPSGEPPGSQWFPEQEEFIMAVYKDVSKNFNINTNRVYLDGFSNGGNGVWFYGISFPWLFGAICPRSGACSTSDALKNLLNVGTYITHGDQDSIIPCTYDRQAAQKLKELGYEVFYLEVPGGDHSPFNDETPNIMEYFNKHPRNPWAEKVIFSSHKANPTRVYWIEVTKASGRFSLEGEVQAGNKIVITYQGTEEIIVNLSDALVDMEKPVQIMLNEKKVHNEIVPRSLEALVTDLRQNRDINAAACARLKFSVN
ncbi:MAG: hypothetical protein V1701_07760 [Planctomycetota bacterium]